MAFNKQDVRTLERLIDWGVKLSDGVKLLIIERTLHRWAEMACGHSDSVTSWSIVRDEDTGKPFMEMIHSRTGMRTKRLIVDREGRALKRLAKIMESYPSLTYYHQTDPRGSALYILRKEDITGPIDSCYTNGVGL